MATSAITSPRATAALSRLTPEQELTFELWRNEALSVMPYAAPLLYRFSVFNAPGLNTMACDAGLRLYIDMDYCLARGDRWCAEGLLHECMHIYGRHFERAKSYGVGDDSQQQRDWNIATDAANNDDLIEVGCSTLATGEDPTPSMLNQANHLTPEHYYDVIRAKRKGQPQQPPSGQPQPGSGEASGSGLPAHIDAFSGCGSVSGGQNAPCELPQDGGQFGTSASAISNDEIANAIEDMAQQATTYSSNSRGTVPAGVLSEASIILAPPVVDWRSKIIPRLSRACAVAGTGRSTYTKVNRRLRNVSVGGRRVIYPGKVRPQRSLVTIRDTSGSMSDDYDLPRASGEIINIAKRVGVRGKNLQVIDVDAHAYDPVPFTSQTSIRGVRGRGGTDLCRGFEKIAELGLNPDAVIVLSDTGTPWPQETLPYPVFVVGIGQYAPDTKPDNMPDSFFYIKAQL